MADFDFEALVVRLGEEFKRREMNQHVQHLREYYARRKTEQRTRGAAKHVPWTESLVIQWLAIFRIPPFERLYPVQSGQAACFKCHATAGGRSGGAQHQVRIVFPGGTLIECRMCGARWTTTDPPPRPRGLPH